MVNPFAAGLRYFLIVFAMAFAIGTVRTLLVASRTGAIIAVSLELLLVLALAWLAALATPAGLLGLAGQIGFGLMPLVVARSHKLAALQQSPASASRRRVC
jgi:hypothetical protein